MTLVPNPEFLAMTQEERNRIMAEQYANFVAKKAAESAPLVGGGRKNPQAAKATVQLVRGSDVVPEPIQWLWPGYLAQGKLHILAGAPGTGKTTIALRLAAIVSSGGQWPSGGYCPVGDVVIWSGEDGIEDTLVPRLIAAGADLNRVHLWTV